jgi:hypothetical protein
VTPSRPSTPAPKFDPALPVSSWLWPKLQAYLATQAAAAKSRPKVPPLVRLLLALPLLVFMGDLVGVAFFKLSNQMGLQALALSIAPRIILETLALVGLTRRDLLGKAQTTLGYLLSLAAFGAFMVYAFASVPFWFLPLALVIIYGPWAWRAYRHFRDEILTGGSK